VATVTVTYPGNYTVKPSDPVAQGSTSGSGSGATFNITWTTQYTRSVVTSEAGVAPWVRLGASSFAGGLMPKANAYDFLTALVTVGSGFSVNKATSPPTITTTLNPTLVPNYISGLTMSTAGSSATMSIAAGVANDSTNTTLMNLSSAISKTTSSWAVGSGNGGLDTGAIATSTWYHFYEIERVDTGVVDVVFSTNATTPTLPTSYTLYRRIGSGKTDGSSQWTKFTQTGDTFIWAAPVTDVSGIATTTSRANKVLSVPTGVVVAALFRVAVNANSASFAMIITSLLENDQAPVRYTLGDLGSGGGAGFGAAGSFERLTDTSAQVGVRSDTASDTYSISTFGWKDSRGQN
jgi:hypothetical protein